MTASTAVEPTDSRELPPRRPFAPGSRMWDETGLVTFSLTAGSAFLLQTMEPTISAVVDAHSTFRTDPTGRALRSLASVMMWVYGGEEGIAEADRLRTMHATLNTTTPDGVRHTALSSGPWAWVLHTGTFAFTENGKYFARRPLSYEEKQTYYREAVQLLRNFSVPPKEIPEDFAAFEEYFADMVDNHLVATDTARDYLRVIRAVGAPKQLPRALVPAWKAAVSPIGRLQYFVTVGTTPENARRKLGLEWSEADERKLRLIGRVIAYGLPLLPERLRYFPIAYEARRLERDRARLRKVISQRPL
ncbi:oxygenase MpaB family protein [Nocardia arizonensis]|uniref:oxygenase MpaB family protein n=1 Tax=Nocardia arizonensis TaxID=1141647 RepID=UPI0006D11866|nr:oxygenase MpaB family protein [Nocardia arizonensis]